jgi:hypothetical protein
MLAIKLPAAEYFDEETGRFETVEAVEVELEHSLISLSKWESKHEKPFLDGKDRTNEEVLDYISCMITSGKVPEHFTDRLTKDLVRVISAHIEAKMTATWFNDKNAKPSREVITSELIYYWMFSLNIPKECETWHLNRLLTLLKVCHLKSQPPKKMGKAELAARNRELNAQRRAKFGTSG